MGLPIYLAFTSGELPASKTSGYSPAWLSCHFSSHGNGLSNLPEELPPGALILIDDSLLPRGHCPEMICCQLNALIEKNAAGGIILDFQRGYDQETAQVVRVLQDRITCPVAVTAAYAKESDGPVWLPPIPPNIVPGRYLSAFKGREIWLELSPSFIQITLTQSGASQREEAFSPNEAVLSDKKLFCHYTYQVFEDKVTFFLCRTQEDICSLIRQAESLGVRKAVGIYRELVAYLSTPAHNLK